MLKRSRKVREVGLSALILCFWLEAEDAGSRTVGIVVLYKGNESWVVVRAVL